MTEAFDERIIKVTIDFGDGNVKTYSDLYIYAKGYKGMSSLMSGCSITITNLTPEDRNYILTKSSIQINGNPREPVLITLEVGRKSTGTFRLFTGFAMASFSLQPPDIGITLNSLTNNFNQFAAQGLSLGELATTATIAQKIAENNNLTLDNQATDKQIENFNFSGSLQKQIEELEKLGGVVVSVDNETLVVLDKGKYRQSSVRKINSATGMVGIPEVNTYGINCKMMIDNSIKLGGKVEVESKINPAANGEYFVYGINFEVANRENPFWYDLMLYNPLAYSGFR